MCKAHVTEDFNCNCPDCLQNKQTCKHQYAVRYYLQVEHETPNGIKSQRTQINYKQAWRAYNDAQTQEITRFDELLKDLVAGIAEPEYVFGRPRLSKKDVVFCCIQKAYSQLSSRRAVSLFGNAVERQQITAKPHFTSVNNYLRDASLTPILEDLVTLSASPLQGVERDFAVDSTGFKTTCFSEYCEDKYELNREHKWIKAHACVGVKTNVVTRVIITGEDSADSPQFPALVQATANGGFTVQEVSADKGYSGAVNFNVVQNVGGQAYIPFKSNATGETHGSKYRLWRKMFFYYQLHAEEFYAHYHKRSNVESTFAAIKKKLGDTLKAKTFTSQKNELLCKIIAYNMTVLIQQMFELGITLDFQREEKVGEVNKKC